jgi:hypothetical protein
MTTRTDRTRGATGKLIDPEAPALKEWFDNLNGQYPDHGPVRLDGPLLMVETKTHGPAIVMTEGVGYWQGEGKDVINAPIRWDAMGFGDVDIPTEILVAAAENGEEVDLADHIRVFGSRLENNFFEWFEEVTGKSPWA